MISAILFALGLYLGGCVIAVLVMVILQRSAGMRSERSTYSGKEYLIEFVLSWYTVVYLARTTIE